MMKHLWVVALLLLPSLAAADDDTAPPPTPLGFTGYFLLGGEGVATADTDAALRGASIPVPGNAFIAIGGGGFLQFRSLLIGGEGVSLLQQSSTSAALRTDRSGGYGVVDLGWSFYETLGLRLLLKMGIGGGGITDRITGRNPLTYQQVLANPATGASLSAEGWILRPALGIDIPFYGQPHDGRLFGPMVGLRAGWVFTNGWSWTLDETRDLAGGPVGRLNGPFVLLALGFSQSAAVVPVSPIRPGPP